MNLFIMCKRPHVLSSFKHIAALARGYLAIIFAISMLWVPGFSYGQGQLPTPTPEQMQLLNSLPPAQREQILQQIRQVQGSRSQQGNQPNEFPNVVQPLPAGVAGTEDLEEAQNLPPRLEPGSTVVIQFSFLEDEIPPATGPVRPQRPELSTDERARLEVFRNRLAAGNPYVLDVAGNLYLPGVPTMALAGLTVEEAAIRVKAETSLREFEVIVTLLPLEPVGVDALEPFGYSLFDGVPTTFAPATDIPVPAEYVMGPGDTVNVQLFGNQNAEYALVISREGTINFPEIGPINVGGLTFLGMREVLTQRVAEQMIGVRSSITLGELRSIRIFVLGDVVRPGSYTVSGLSTMTNALFVSGGVEQIGSLRRIELKREGETVSMLDLYDLLLRGDTSDDARLLPGDVIFVPPIGDIVAVEGSVRRPAIYELNGEDAVDELIELAGGLRPSADSTTIKLERIVPGRGVSVRDIDLSSEMGRAEPLRNGDVVRVPANMDLIEEAVRLVGNVFQPGLYQWREGMLLTDLINSPERLKPLSDLNYVLVRREIEPNVFVEALSADLQAAWRDPTSPENISLQPRDSIYVFNLEIGRDYIVAPLLSELEAQAPANQPIAIARVGGQVRAPGDYPLEPGMRISDLIRAGGGLAESAYVTDAELTRYEIVGGESREIALITVDLAEVLAGNLSADLFVTAHDYLNVREMPLWRDQQNVEVLGEVQFPGTYPIRQGEMLSSVLERAGGLTQFAFPEGSVFLRRELAEREREQLQTLARRVETDLTAISISDTASAEALTVGQTLATQLRNTQPTGRLVVNLREIVAGIGRDVALKDGDRLLVPDAAQSVTVLGEVQYSTSHLYDQGLSRDEYIARSGGLTGRADQRRIYIVRANGEVVTRARSVWFARSRTSDIRPGDTIVVPLDVSSGRRLTFWGSVTQIIYNLAIAAAAVDSFGS